MVRSEHTHRFSEEEILELQDLVKNMTQEELKAYRNSFDPDFMGFADMEDI